MWTGFKTSVDMYENNSVKLLVDFTSRILRADTVLDYIWNLKNSKQGGRGGYKNKRGGGIKMFI